MLATERKLLGILFLGGRFNYKPDDMARLGIPYVCCTYTNTFGSLDPASYSSIAIDDKKEAHDAVMRLYACGHRRIAALIASENDQSISELRFAGYKQALAECGLPLVPSLVECTGSFDMPAAYEGMKRLIARNNTFTAVFIISDAMAIASVKALTDSGCRVPEDRSVIAIDGLELSKYTIPTLTTLEQPADTIVRQSAGLLIDIMEGKAQNRHVVLGTNLREGGSVMPIH